MANNERKDHFSIRKFSVGAASVVVGASVFGLAAGIEASATFTVSVYFWKLS